jgi:uncharacterized membrane protein
MDFWAWDRTTPMFMGVPVWIFYFVLLSALQTVGMVLLLRSSSSMVEDAEDITAFEKRADETLVSFSEMVKRLKNDG